MAEKIALKAVSKVFGPAPDKALELARQGLGKDEVFDRTGSAIGVFDASFTVNAGEIFVVMGLSGSGKSTVLRMLNRLIEPTTGEIVIDGRDIVTMAPEELVALRRRDIAMVFQSFALLPHLSVLENAAFGLEVAGVDHKARLDRAHQALEQVGLKASADLFPDELSGGMQQRVGLARALATEPSILLMDEAFSALDPLLRRDMQEDLLKLQEREEHTVVFVSHDLDEAMRIGDRIAIMQSGRLLQAGTPREILDAPATDYVRSFFQNVDIGQVYTAGDICQRADPVFREGRDTAAEAASALASRGVEYGYVVDEGDRLLGMVSAETLRSAPSGAPASEYRFETPNALSARTPLSRILGPVARASFPLPVLGRRGRLVGVVSRAELLKALEKNDE